MSTPDWARRGLDPQTFDTLATGLTGSQLWSLLLDVMAQRARARTPGDLTEQWAQDRFVQPAAVDQRTLNALDSHLLAAADGFDAIELSPVAPLGVCSVLGLASQNKILSALRGTEVVSDPTNVMALECGRRLRQSPTAVHLVTSHRCMRAQAVPKQAGFAAHFRIFCLATAGFEQPDHAFTVGALVAQIQTMLRALDRLDRHGYAFPDRQVTVLATAKKAHLGDRIAEALSGVRVTRGMLEHQYYDGLRFQISARTAGGIDVPLIDGGTFDWLTRLLSTGVRSSSRAGWGRSWRPRSTGRSRSSRRPRRRHRHRRPPPGLA